MASIYTAYFAMYSPKAEVSITVALRYEYTAWIVPRRYEYQLKQTNRHPFNGLLYKTTWVSWYRKQQTNLDFNEARDDGATVALGGP